MNQQVQDGLPPLSKTRRKPSLAEQLTTFQATMLARMAPDDADVIRRSEAVWATAGATMLRVGEMAPDFTLPDQHGRATRLRDRLALGPVALLFIRGGWCPFCTILLRAWAEALPALQEAGGDLLAVSPQPVPACGNVAERDLLAYPVLSDRAGAVAASFGVDWQVPELARPLYIRLGHDLPVLNGDGSWRAPLPAVFVLDRNGRITLAHADRAVARRLDPADVIAAVQAAEAGNAA
jgi:peroxiredoxin